MTSKQKIKVTISPSGDSTVEAEGIVGESCSVHTRPFVEALGDVTEEIPTAEMFMETEQEQEQEVEEGESW